jgi:leucyl-tRNA synthetase
MRLYEMFMGPLDKGAPWSDDAIPGVYRFLQRAYRLFVEDADDGERLVDLVDGSGTPEQQRLTAKAIDGVTEDVEAMRFNTAISKLMVFSREVVRDAALPREIAETFILLLSPFAPHLAEELWQQLGHPQSLAAEPWPTADAALLEESTLTLAVQVNGKRRDEIEVAADADEETIRRAALASPGVARQLGDREPKRVIIVPGRLVNIVG